MENLIIYEKPKLNNPSLVGGFAGWPNAGEISTGSITYLKNKLEAKKFAELKGEEFYIFQLPGAESLRPYGVIEGGIVKDIKPHLNEFYYWKNEKGGDLVFFRGDEPQLNPEKYIDSFLKLAEQVGVKRIYTVGGVHEKIPHTRKPRISATVSDPKLKEELSEYDIEFIDYKGPVSIHTMLPSACIRKGMESIALWGSSTYYPEHNIIVSRNPKSWYAMVEMLTKMLQVDIDLEDLRKLGEEVDTRMDQLFNQVPGLSEYVEKLEEEYDRERKPMPVDLESKEIIREIEEQLRQQRKAE
ncbi:MAG: PAC2 family protein [Candidatus Aenigmarchaeota archaeon]|nr:PAC2 family protein [Candidatus Aenigmarchaeota archaeon]